MVSQLIPSIIAFLTGVAVLVYSVEELVESISETAIRTGVSAFFLSVVFAGMDFENWAFGITSNIRNLPGIAVGSVIGSAFFLICVALGIGCIITPFSVDVGKRYIFLLLLTPLALSPTLVDLHVTPFEGFYLLSVFAGILYFIYRKESDGDTFFRDEEVSESRKEGPVLLSFYRILVFTAGLVAGSEFAVTGTEGILISTGMRETAFGMTFVGLVIALEEIMLVVEPVRKKEESIAVGNIVGSILFFLSGNIGLIAVFGGLRISAEVLKTYIPLLMFSILVLSYFLYMGELKRKQGWFLLGLYLVVWILSYLPVPLI